MKKRTTFFLLILTIALSATTVACTKTQSPSDVFQSMADAYQKKDDEKANEYAIQPQLAEQYIDYSDEIENMVTLDPLTSTTPERSSILSRLIDGKIRDFDYEIVSESVNGDDATLTVQGTVYDLERCLTTVMNDAVTEWDESMTRSERERLVLKIKNDLGEEIRKTAKDKVLTVSVTAKRMEGAWKIDLDNGELMNLFTGNLYK
jgi:hypothetical protein